MLALAAVTALAGGVVAQAGLEVNASRANFGVHSLRAGFTPDPNVIRVTSGGSLDASNIDGLPAGCAGFVTARPDVVLNFTGRSQMLRFFVDTPGNEATKDTTLIINDGAGNWHCNDDVQSGNFDPLIDIRNPPAGHYDIWIGSYRSGQNVTADFKITELESQRP